VEVYLHFPNSPSWRGAQLKYRDKFTFTLHFTTKILVVIPVGVPLDFTAKGKSIN
jgi:hypothetical protein